MKRLAWMVWLLWIVLGLVPLWANDYLLHLFIMILYYGFLSQSWNIMSGYSGQFSFGHAAFFGIGAYVSSMLLVKMQLTPWIGMLLGAGIALLVGLFIGFLSFRYKLKGAYFALATLAFAEILRLLISSLELFNKTLGILIPLKADPSMYQFSSRVPYFYVIFLMMTAVTLFVYWMSRNRLGFNLAAIRENEDAAQSLGVNAYRNKMIAIGISAALTALGGTFYAQYLLFIDPSVTFGSDLSLAILLPTIIGGAGTVLGPIIGSFLLTPLGEITRSLLGGFAGVHLIVYGAILIAVILYLPEGIVGWLQNRLNKQSKSGTSSDGAALEQAAFEK